MRLGIITDGGIGGHFLSWSLYYLSGVDYYWDPYNNCAKKIEHNPLKDNNCHGHHASHPTTKTLLDERLDVPLDNQDLDIIFIQNVDHGEKNYTAESIQTLVQKCDKIIVVTLDASQTLYRCSTNRRTKNNTGIGELLNSEIHEYDNLQTVWDKREFLALNLKPMQHRTVTDFCMLDFDHYRLEAQDLWHAFESSIKDLLDYCELTLKVDRMNNWTKIYKTWQTFHYQQLKFSWYFDTILYNILNNVDMDLERFNLDLTQQSAIQHELIYRHNLNLKTWQLENFSNTKQLHNLLEKNTHTI